MKNVARASRRRACRAPSRIRLLATLLALAHGAPIALAVQQEQQEQQETERSRPNILFCIADDWGWPHASAYGDPVVETPTFDRIAREGVLFEAAFASSPSCTPSRNAILTGQHFFRLGEGANLWSTLSPQHAVFPRTLEQAGYHVGHWRKAWGPGKWDRAGRKLNPAGEHYESFPAFLSTLPDETPFCFWLGTSDPHRGYRKGSGAESGMRLEQIRIPPPLPDNEVVRGDIADYYYEVQRFDRDVGQALALLEERGLLDNTVVVMTSDHGWPFPRGKTNLYDLGSRVPLAVRWSERIAPGQRVAWPTLLVDLAPTFLEAAGVPRTSRMTGSSLLPLVTGERVAPGQPFVILGRERHTIAQGRPRLGYPMRALRNDQYLYIRNYHPERWPAGVETRGSRPFRDCDNGPTKSYITDSRNRDDPAFQLSFGQRPAEELYHLALDPWQLENVIDDPAHAEAAHHLSRRLGLELKRLKDPRVVGGEEIFERGTYHGR